MAAPQPITVLALLCFGLAVPGWCATEEMPPAGGDRTEAKRTLRRNLPLKDPDFSRALRSGGVPQEHIQRVMDGTLVRSPQRVDEVAAWLREHGVTNPEKVIAAAPRILNEGMESRFAIGFELLKNEGATDVATILTRAPTIFYHLDSSALKAKIAALKELGVSDIGQLVDGFPEILTYNSDKLRRKIQWLKKQGVTDLNKVLLDFPGFLGLSLYDKAEPAVRWLKSQGVTDIGKVLQSAPRLLALNLEENIKPKVRFLKKEGFQDIGKMIQIFPKLFEYNLETNIQPTLEHLSEVWGLSIKDIEQSPMLLATSLKRLKGLVGWLRVTAAEVNLKALPLKTRANIIKQVSKDTLVSYLRRLYRELAALLGKDALTQGEEERLLGYLRASGDFEKFLRPAYPMRDSQCLLQQLLKAGGIPEI